MDRGLYKSTATLVMTNLTVGHCVFLPEYSYARCDVDGHEVEPFVTGAIFLRQMVSTIVLNL